MIEHVLFITWQKHRRPVTISSRLGIKHVCYEVKNKKYFKYPILLYQTLALLRKERPLVLFVQNPSIVLVLTCLLCRIIFRYYLIVDAHNIGVIWDKKGKIFFQSLLNLMHRKADFTIVSNAVLSLFVEKNGGKAFILPDAIPDFSLTKLINPLTYSLNDKFIVTFICTFSSDEPFLEVFESINFLPDDIVIFVTGNYRSYDEGVREKYEDRVIFTGYLPDNLYLGLLSRSNCVMDLTKRDDCLVCGAYEAISFNVPLVLSDTNSNRLFFNKGVEYAKNNANDIAQAIMRIKNNYEIKTKEIILLRSELQKKWEQQSILLLDEVHRQIKKQKRPRYDVFKTNYS